MALTIQEVKEIALLARIEVKDSEVAHFQNELSRILAFVAELQSINTEYVEPLSNPLDQVQRLRADQVTEIDHHQDYQQGAPSVENGLYLVPKVVE